MSSKAAIATHDTLVVFCGKLQGMLDPTRFGPGPKSRCIEHGGRWLTPPEFEVASGKSKHYRWKSNIKTETGANFDDLIENGTLKCCPKSCSCIICDPCPEVSPSTYMMVANKDTDSDSGISIGSSSTNKQQQPQGTLLKTISPGSCLPPPSPLPPTPTISRSSSTTTSQSATSSSILDYPSMVQEAIFSLSKGHTDCTNLNILLYILNRHTPSEPIASVHTKIRNSLAFLVRMGFVKTTANDDDEDDEEEDHEVRLANREDLLCEEVVANPETTKPESPKMKTTTATKKPESSSKKGKDFKTSLSFKKAEELKAKAKGHLIAKADKTSSNGEEKVKRTMVFQPKRLSPALAAVCGRKFLTRPDVIKRVWKYIKAKKLQDPNNKTTIFCDDKLRGVTKKKKINQNEFFAILKHHMKDR